MEQQHIPPQNSGIAELDMTALAATEALSRKGSESILWVGTSLWARRTASRPPNDKDGQYNGIEVELLTERKRPAQETTQYQHLSK